MYAMASSKSFLESGGITEHLMAGPSGNSEFCFPSTSIFECLGETKLTVSLVASHIAIWLCAIPKMCMVFHPFWS